MAIHYRTAYEDEEPPLCPPEVLRGAAIAHALGKVPIVSAAYACEMTPLIAPAGVVGGFYFYWFSDLEELGVWSLVSIAEDPEMVQDYVL